MKRMTRLVMAGVLLGGLSVWTGCGEKAGEKAVEEAPPRTELVVGITETFPPLEFPGEDGEYTGYDVELARETCRRRGWKLRFEVIDWKSMEQALANHRIDCIWAGCTITDERLTRMAFTPGYLRNEQVVVVRDESPVHRISQLKGKTLSVQAGSTAMAALEDTPELRNVIKEVFERVGSDGAFLELDDGHADAVIMDLLVANYMIRREGRPFRILDEGLAPEEYGVAFRKGDEALAGQVWRTLQEMAADGFVKRLSEKWFGTDISIIPSSYVRN